MHDSCIKTFRVSFNEKTMRVISDLEAEGRSGSAQEGPKLSEEQALEIVGEYLAAFLGSEQDWGVIDSLSRARSEEEALRAYDEALRSVHRVMERFGFDLLVNLAKSDILSDVIKEKVAFSSDNVLYVQRAYFNELLDSASRLISTKMRENSTQVCLRLVERALAKYPKYMPR